MRATALATVDHEQAERALSKILFEQPFGLPVSRMTTEHRNTVFQGVVDGFDRWVAGGRGRVFADPNAKVLELGDDKFFKELAEHFDNTFVGSVGEPQRQARPHAASLCRTPGSLPPWRCRSDALRRGR